MDRDTTEFYNRYVDDGAIDAEAAQSAVSKHFQSAFKAGSKVLDAGAGSGRDLAELHRLGFDAYGIEPNDAMRSYALRKHPQLAGRLQAGSLPVIGSSPAVPFGGRFDAIVCSAVIMHIPEPDLSDVAASMRALLNPQGRVLISLPFMRPDLLDGERDPDGRFFQNHALDSIKLLMEQQGFSQIGRWDSGSPGSADTLWFVLLFERTDKIVSVDKQLAGLYKQA